MSVDDTTGVGPGPASSGSPDSAPPPQPEPDPNLTPDERELEEQIHPGLRSHRGQAGDQIFSYLARGTGVLVIVLIAAIGISLLIDAVPAIIDDNANFLFSSEWNVSGQDFANGTAAFGVWELFRATVLTSFFALVLATPVAIGIAVFLVEYAPNRISRPLGAVIDLLAAVPSIIFGLWGIYVLAPVIAPFAEWLNSTFGWFFLFASGKTSIAGGGTIFTAGIVLAIMMLPIITSITREVLRQTPTAHKEAAQALGATKWEVIRMTAFPYSRSGMIAASMLALGRALGETIALMIILSAAVGRLKWSLFEGGDTFASKIARDVGEFVGSEASAGAYIAAGLVLFVLTFVVNAIARVVAGGKVNG
ncbi:phosphate ABC transporter permease subunit PstC [Gordonia rhizosphera]|uniref:phosphate ABC transporter permease subunit PstC n=1 Tax=Gordonia rhizosphera TaxID=83341 RepID=UPI00058D153D|nr:phosphate ABC transporter permease subunit PstC [Gordonia rhizosphera]